VLIGSDVPDLPPLVLKQAFDAMATNPDAIVLGPLIDGSCYLIGLSVRVGGIPDVQSGIRWGTTDVLLDLQRAAERLGLAVVVLDAWSDVDSPSDLDRLIA